MKLCRLGRPGREIPCVLDAADRPRDVSEIVPDFGPSQIAAGLVDRLAGADLSALPVVPIEGRRIGPPVVTRDEVADPRALAPWLDVSGAPMQRGSTASMIFSMRRIVSHMSQFCRLEPLICVRSDAGWSSGTLGIEGLGNQGQAVTEPAGSAR